MQQKIWRYVVCSMSIVAAILVNDFATLQPVKVTWSVRGFLFLLQNHVNQYKL